MPHLQHLVEHLGLLALLTPACSSLLCLQFPFLLPVPSCLLAVPPWLLACSSLACLQFPLACLQFSIACLLAVLHCLQFPLDYLLAVPPPLHCSRLTPFPLFSLFAHSWLSTKVLPESLLLAATFILTRVHCYLIALLSVGLNSKWPRLNTKSKVFSIECGDPVWKFVLLNVMSEMSEAL